MIPLKSVVLALTILAVTNPSISLSIDKHNNELEDSPKSPRNGRILWSYQEQNDTVPSNENNKETVEPLQTENVEPEGAPDTKRKQGQNRKKRFLLWSYPQSPLVEMIMQQTASVNYSPANGNDPFDFLRDSYPLPKGKLLFYILG